MLCRLFILFVSFSQLNINLSWAIQQPEASVFVDTSHDSQPCRIVQSLYDSCLPARSAESSSSLIRPCNCVVPFLDDIRSCLADNEQLMQHSTWIRECIFLHDAAQRYKSAPAAPGSFHPRALTRRSNIAPRKSALHRRSEHWSTIQILVPVIVGLGVTTFWAILFFYFYRKTLPQKRPSMSNIRGTLPASRSLFRFGFTSRVREAGRSNAWVIDQPDNTDNAQRSVYHQQLMSSSDHPFGHSNDPSWLSNTLGSVRGAIPTPWKRKPVPIKSIPAKRGFRIDGSDRATSVGTSSLPPPPRHSIADTIDDEHPPNDQPWKYLPQALSASDGSGRVGTEQLYMGEDPGSDADSGDDNEPDPDEEHTSLMSASSPMGGHANSIILISRTGNDFSVDSEGSHEVRAVNIIPPTPIKSPGPSRHPKIPTPPSYPAPTPNTPPRKPHPLLDPQFHHTGSSRLDLGPQSLSPPPARSDTQAFSSPPIIASPSPHKRQLSNGSLKRAEHVRRPSADFLLRSPPIPGRALDQISLSSPSPPLASSAQVPPSSTSPRPDGWSSAPYLPNIPLAPQRREPAPPREAASHRGRQFSQDSTISEIVHPYPARTHLASPEPAAPRRSVSAEHLARPARTDPVMLFPGSVRGAGYHPGSMMTASSESLYSQGSGIPRPQR